MPAPTRLSFRLFSAAFCCLFWGLASGRLSGSGRADTDKSLTHIHDSLYLPRDSLYLPRDTPYHPGALDAPEAGESGPGQVPDTCPAPANCFDSLLLPGENGPVPEPFPWPTELPGVIARAEKEPGPRPRGHEATGTYRLTHAELSGAISGLGDPSRIVQTLPGVGRPSDWLTTLIVRGGAPDQNAYLLDGMPALKVSHYEDMRGRNGGVGIINLAFLEELSFHNGAFAARYPDKLSSVVELRFRDGSTREPAAMLTVDVTGLGAVAEGPIPLGGDTGSYAATFRYSTMALLLDAGILESFGVPTYYNGHVRLFAPLAGGELRLNALGGDDEWLNKIRLGRGGIGHAVLNFKGRTGALGGEWRRKNPLGESRAAAYYHRRSQQGDFYFLGPDGNRLQDSLGHQEHARDDMFSLSLDHELLAHPRLKVRVGGLEQLLLREYALDYAHQKTYLPRLDTVVVRDQERSLESPFYSNAAVYGEAVLGLDRWELYAGYRHFYEEYTDNHGYGPRLGVRFFPGEKHTLKAALGRHTQAHSFADVALRDNPLAARLPYNWQAVAGYAWQAPFSLLATVEIFQKEAHHLPRRRHAWDGRFYRPTYVDTGRATSQGLEIYLKRSKVGRLSGSATYNLLRHLERDAEGVWVPTAYSVPHRFNIAVGYDPLPGLTASARLSLASGQPYIPFDSTLSERAGTGVYDYGEAYRRREPHFSRLDLRLEFRHTLKGAELKAFTEVANVLDRHNRFERVWDPLDGGDMVFPGMGLLPMAGLTVRF